MAFIIRVILSSGLVVVFFVAVAVQILFYILFFTAFARATQTLNYSPSVSVVVCAHNEAQNLRELIPLLLNQNYSEYEVIIVDDRSNDGTDELLRETTSSDKRVRRIRIEQVPQGMNAKKYALSLAIKTACNEIVLLTDADCRPLGAHWISTMAGQFDEGTQIVLSYSPYVKERSFLNSFIRFETLMTGIQYLGLAVLGMPYMGVGRNLAYRRSLFLENKGFKNIMNIVGGDDDLFINAHANSANTRVSLSKNGLVYSVPKKTWRSFLQQKLRHLSVGKYYKPAHKWVLGIFMLSFIVSWMTGLASLALSELTLWIIIALVVRWILVLTVIYLASKRLGDKFDLWSVIFLDFIYAIYYLSTGLRALLTRKIKWTT